MYPLCISVSFVYTRSPMRGVLQEYDRTTLKVRPYVRFGSVVDNLRGQR